MYIEKILLKNYKCFENITQIDCLTKDLSAQKRIILFGGLNGAGKTTIFEALLLCLYGQNNKSLWPSKGAKREDYGNYISSIINTNIKLNDIRPELGIEITLKDVDFGDIAHTLTIKRYWTLDTVSRSIIKESLLIEHTETEKPFSYISEDDWQDLILELIPYDTSQFFFFDGEKIQDFVKDEDKEFADSLEKVLGITLYRTLQDDLEVTRRRLLTEYNENKDIKAKIFELGAEIENAKVKMEEFAQKLEDLEDENEKKRKEIEIIDLETRRITRVKAESKEEYERIKDQLLDEKARLEEKVLTTIQDDIPFVITAQICREIIDQIEEEEKILDYEIAQHTIEPKIEIVTSRIFEGQESIPPLTKSQQEFYIEKISKILKETLINIPSSPQHILRIHELSKNDSFSIKNKVNNSFGVINDLNTYLQRLQEIEPKLRNAIQEMRRTSDPEAEKLYEKRGQLLEQINILNNEKVNIKAEIDKITDDIGAKNRQMTDLEVKSKKTAKMLDEMEYCKKLKHVLDDFLHELRVSKVEKLQDYTIKMWKKLARKQDQVKEVKINPDKSFTIDLYDHNDELLDKTKLSAGEKELLAISLIWALTQIADRSLPIVIDTPLGRLDSIHRNHIVKNYFPNAGHQVILLSTNTEIVGEDLNSIRPYISKTYLIQKDKARETSKIIEGYFE